MQMTMLVQKRGGKKANKGWIILLALTLPSSGLVWWGRKKGEHKHWHNFMVFMVLHKFRLALDVNNDHAYNSNFVNLHISHRARRCQSIQNRDLRRNLFVDIARFRCISNECINSSRMHINTTTVCCRFSHFLFDFDFAVKVHQISTTWCCWKWLPWEWKKWMRNGFLVFLDSFDIAHNNPDDTPHWLFSGLNCIIGSNVISSSRQFVEHTRVCMWQSNIDIRHLTPQQRQVFFLETEIKHVMLWQ